jgi:hypothetical protein
MMEDVAPDAEKAMDEQPAPEEGAELALDEAGQPHSRGRRTREQHPPEGVQDVGAQWGSLRRGTEELRGARREGVSPELVGDRHDRWRPLGHLTL